MVQMKQGQEYKRRDGAKVTQHEAICTGRFPWFGSDGVCRDDSGKTSSEHPPWALISEWPSEPEGKDTAEDKPKWSEWILRDWRQSWDSMEFTTECQVSEDANGDVVAYRIRMGPVTGTEKFDVFCAKGFGAEVVGTDGWDPTHSVTLPTTDGTPITGVYTNDAGDTITLEEIDNA
jgi:hypothetical protein